MTTGKYWDNPLLTALGLSSALRLLHHCGQIRLQLWFCLLLVLLVGGTRQKKDNGRVDDSVLASALRAADQSWQDSPIDLACLIARKRMNTSHSKPAATIPCMGVCSSRLREHVPRGFTAIYQPRGGCEGTTASFPSRPLHELSISSQPSTNIPRRETASRKDLDN